MTFHFRSYKAYSSDFNDLSTDQFNWTTHAPLNIHFEALIVELWARCVIHHMAEIGIVPELGVGN